MIEAKIYKLGSQIKGYGLETGATVRDLLEAASEEDINELGLTRRGNPVGLDTRLEDNDIIFIGKAVRGNTSFEVTFIRLGSTSISLGAESGNTIKEVLQNAGNDTYGSFFFENGEPRYEFRVKGVNSPVSENHQLIYNGETLRVVCSQQVKGNKNIPR